MVWNRLNLLRIMRIRKRSCALAIACLSIFIQASYAGNEVLGELQLEGATKVEKTSGVWIDGQYLGYLKELKRSKKILLLPGEHKIAVRQTPQRAAFDRANREVDEFTVDGLVQHAEGLTDFKPLMTLFDRDKSPSVRWRIDYLARRQ